MNYPLNPSGLPLVEKYEAFSANKTLSKRRSLSFAVEFLFA